jgi:hypothetical protein
MSKVLVAMLMMLLIVGSESVVEPLWLEAGAIRHVRAAEPEAPDHPTISTIESPSPTCYRPGLHSNICRVNWGLVRVSTVSPRTIVSVTLTIDGRMRANYQGYFQSSLSVEPGFHGDGFQVACGFEGVDGVAGMGRVYDWRLKALDSEGLEATNKGTVTCPAWHPISVYLPLVQRE